MPFGGTELYAMGELLSVSDDNSRTAGQLALRRRLPSHLALLYAGSFMAYDQQTALYYSPARYFSQSLGIEWASYREQGLSFALRAAPGYAWMREPAGTADSATRDLSAFQFTTGLELGFRRGAWDLLVNTTPVGTSPAVDQTPLDASCLTGGGLVYDLVYNPGRTRLLREAAAAGCQIIGGLDMLVAQAALQVATWFPVTPPIEAMRAAIHAEAPHLTLVPETPCP